MSEIKHKIQFEGKDYIVTEPTIKDWSKLTTEIDLLDDRQLALSLITQQTGISRAELIQCDWADIYNVSQNIMSYIEGIDKTKFYRTFTFEGVDYEFIDLSKLSFGHFVDLDTYLGKTDVEKMDGLNYYMALLYKEVGTEGYDTDKVKIRKDVFNRLPIKYYFGANQFFFLLERLYLKNTRVSFYLTTGWYKMKKMIVTPLVVFLGGILLSLRWQGMMLRKLRRLLKSLWSSH